MPPKSRFRNKKKNKNNNSPYQHPNQNPNQPHPNHPAASNHQNNHHNRGRPTSRTRSNRSRSRKPYNRPSTPKPKHFQKPNVPHAPHTPPSSPGVASKATHTLRSTLLSSPTGILKRRVSLGLSVTLPSTAASARLKGLLLQAIDDARNCVGKMDFDMSSSTSQNTSVDVDICPGAPRKESLGWGGEYDGGAGFGDSGVGMPMDTDIEEDMWDDEEEVSAGAAVDHGCVDIVREHGRMVGRMRWEATDRLFDAQPQQPPGGPPGGPRKTRGNGRLRSQSSAFGGREDSFGGAAWVDEVM